LEGDVVARNVDAGVRQLQQAARTRGAHTRIAVAHHDRGHVCELEFRCHSPREDAFDVGAEVAVHGRKCGDFPLIHRDHAGHRNSLPAGEADRAGVEFLEDLFHVTASNEWWLNVR
jgi:hypothetical protein